MELAVDGVADLPLEGAERFLAGLALGSFLVGGLRDDDVVEVTCLADEHGAHPIAQGRMPDQQLALIDQVKVFERLTVAAAVEGSYDAALCALLAHPLVPSYPVARAILDDYLDALPGLMPQLK